MFLIYARIRIVALHAFSVAVKNKKRTKNADPRGGDRARDCCFGNDDRYRQRSQILRF